MQILRTLKDLSAKINAQFVVIGGHAINAHGYLRSTGDLDIAICATDAAQWKSELLALGYSIFFEQPAFVQLKNASLEAWPIDLMIVNESTFKNLSEAATPFPFRDCTAQIASVPHLLAMKLHALRDRPAHREAKDLGDVAELLKIAKTPENSDFFRQLCEKYGSLWVYEHFAKRSAAKG